MTSGIVVTIAVVGGIAWLGFILVAALRRRGSEEISSNLAPGTTDDVLETRRLENAQKFSVIFAGFLAVSLPLYFLGEQDRQQGFVEQFDQESVDRGAALVVEYDCFSCHGPDGVGGSAPTVEPRSGVSVLWEAPALNDVLYRYSDDEVNFWITYGRGNTPMPPWGVDGGGPMNEAQVEDIVNYLRTIQVSQAEAVGKFDGEFRATQASRLANSEATVESQLVSQRQELADIKRAPTEAPIVSDIAARARALLDGAGEGIDTDGDGLSDSAETGLVALGEELVEALRIVEPLTLDPANPQSVEGVDDLTSATDAVAQLAELVNSGDQPQLAPNLEVAQAALDGGEVDPATGLAPSAGAALDEVAATVEADGFEAPATWDLDSATAFVTALEEAAAGEAPSQAVTDGAAAARSALDGGQDADGDGLASDAETAISEQIASAVSATTPTGATVAVLDPAAEETTTDVPDAEAAASVVAAYETMAINLNVVASNLDAAVATAEHGIAFLEEALDSQRWEIDIEGVAATAFDGYTESAERAVLLFNAYCARCHTAGFTAGAPFTLEAGSGGFGPALWDGRPSVQFGEAAAEPADDLLVQFIINGSEAEVPYGLNGFGSGRMPAFGQILSQDDIVLIARYLRGGDLTGLGSEGDS